MTKWQRVSFRLRRDPTRMGRKHHWNRNFPQADFSGTSQYSARRMERDGRLTCEWRFPVRQCIGRKLQVVSTRFRPGFPLAPGIQLGKRGQKFYSVA
jgi:hypothetical protein